MPGGRLGLDRRTVPRIHALLVHRAMGNRPIVERPFTAGGASRYARERVDRRPNLDPTPD